MSDNRIKSKDDATPFSKFFASACKLKRVYLRGICFPPQTLKQVLQSLFHNQNLEELSVDLSKNELDAVGANVLASLLNGNERVQTLKVVENNLEDQGLELLFNNLRHLKKLDVSDNYRPPKKGHSKAMEALCDWLNEEDCQLEELSLRAENSKFVIKELATTILDIHENTSLSSLDLTGQKMGLEGALALSRFLQLNNSLKKLVWDDNDTPPLGFTSFKSALLRNRNPPKIQKKNWCRNLTFFPLQKLKRFTL